MAASKRKPIGQMLLEKGIINENQLKAGLERQERWGKRLGENLVDLGYLSEKHLAKVLSEIFHVPAIDIDTAPIQKEAIHLIPAEVCVKHRVIPLTLKRIDGKEQMVVAFADPSNLEALDVLRFHAKRPVFQVVSTFSSIDRALRAFYSGLSDYKGSDDRREVTLAGMTENGEPMQVIHDSVLEQARMLRNSQPNMKVPDHMGFYTAFVALIDSLKEKGVLSEEEAKNFLSLLHS